FFCGECADPAIAPHPRVDEPRHFGIVLEERHGRRAIIEEPGKTAVVEVDHLDGAAVHEQVGETHVAVDEFERVRCLAEPAKTPFDEARRLADRFEGLAGDSHSVLPPAPMRSLAKTGLEVPAVALKPGRPL